MQENDRSEATGDRDVDQAESVEMAQETDERAELEQLRAELTAAQDQLLRRAAEFQNYRRRTEEEKRLMVDIGKSVVVESLLDVVDDFARMLEVADSAASSENSLRTGVEMIYRKLMEELRKLGVEPIDVADQPFNENLHEAILRQPAPEGTPPGTILQEVQRGYVMKGRVIRHARVIVASDEA